jgi:hypothetical protein
MNAAFYTQEMIKNGFSLIYEPVPSNSIPDLRFRGG